MEIDILKILKENNIEYKSISGTDEKVIICPVCGKDDHFYFNVKKNLGICHRCKWSCNLLALLMAVLGIKKDAALDLCYGHRDTSLEGLRGRVSQLLNEQNINHNSLDFYEVYFRNPLPSGVKKITKKKFPVIFKKRGVTYEEAISSGAMFCNVSGKYYGRIIFPISTLKNKTFTAVTSLYGKNLERTREKFKRTGGKYRKSLFPPKSFMSEVIYMYDEYKNSCKSLFIVEGIWDFFSIKKIGLNANALLGNFLSKRQAYLLSKTKAKRIFLMLDGSVPIDHIKKVHSLLSEVCFDKEVRVCFLPMDKDPNESSKDIIIESIKNSRKYLLGNLNF